MIKAVTPGDRQTLGTDFGAPPTELPTPSTDFYLDKFQEFSATMTGSVVPGHEDPGYIYRSHNMMRMQGNHAVPQFFVTDLKKKETHGLAASGYIRLGTPFPAPFPSSSLGRIANTPINRQAKTRSMVTRLRFNVTITVPKHPVIPLRFYEAQDLAGLSDPHRKSQTTWL